MDEKERAVKGNNTARFLLADNETMLRDNKVGERSARSKTALLQGEAETRISLTRIWNAMIPPFERSLPSVALLVLQSKILRVFIGYRCSKFVCFASQISPEHADSII